MSQGKRVVYDMLKDKMRQALGDIEVIRDPHESIYPAIPVGRTSNYDFRIVPMDIGAGLSVMSSRYPPNRATPRDWEIGLLFEDTWKDGCVFTVNVNTGKEDPYGYIQLLRDREWISRYEMRAKRELGPNPTRILLDLLLEHQAGLMRTGRYH